MKFNQTSLAARVGQPLTIVLTNDGSLMAHHLVILTPGAEVGEKENRVAQFVVECLVHRQSRNEPETIHKHHCRFNHRNKQRSLKI